MAIKLTKEQQQYIAIGVVLAVGFVYFYVSYVYKPISQKMEDVKSQIADVEKKIEEADREAKSLPRLEQELKQLQQQAVEANRILPQAVSVSDILVTVTHLSEQYDLTLMSFKSATTQAKTFAAPRGGQGGGSGVGYLQHGYSVSVRGSFHQIGKFMAAVASLERLYNVKDISYPGYAGDAVSQGQMTINFTLIAYEYKG